LSARCAISNRYLSSLHSLLKFLVAVVRSKRRHPARYERMCNSTVWTRGPDVRQTAEWVCPSSPCATRQGTCAHPPAGQIPRRSTVPRRWAGRRPNHAALGRGDYSGCWTERKLRIIARTQKRSISFFSRESLRKVLHSIYPVLFCWCALIRAIQ